jgi:photosystem I subunit 12
MERFLLRTMATALSQSEIYIALVVAAHAAILALRLCVSLYRA